MKERAEGARYPRVDFWNKEAEKITFINPKDFQEQRKRLLKNLGLNHGPLAESLGIVDREEIQRRQDLVKFLIKNPEIINFIINANSHVTKLPTSGQPFLDYFNPQLEKNPFWQLFDDFILQLSKCKKLPASISSVLEILKRDRDEVKIAEDRMVNAIIEDVKKATFAEGILVLLTRKSYCKGYLENFDIFEKFGLGYKKYSDTLSKRQRYESIASASCGKWRLIKRLRQWWVGRRLQSLYANLVFYHVPDLISDAIRSFFRKELYEVVCPKEIGEAFFKVFFRYSEKGLEVRIIDVSIKLDQRITSINFDTEKYEGCRSWVISLLKSKRDFLAESVSSTQKNLILPRLLSVVNNAIPDIFNKLVVVPEDFSEEVKDLDRGFKWYDIESLYRSHLDDYEAVCAYRDYLNFVLCSLGPIAAISNSLLQKYREWHMPLCFPRILGEDEHLISFNTLYPIHLVGIQDNQDRVLSAEDIIPISSLPSLNGQMIGFTGQNAGGKTATEEAIINAIFLAQSGLPVFGKSFALNIKDEIGMVFLERGIGSTSEMMLLKLKTILEALKGSQGRENRIVLILDELGGGTQEASGLAFSRRFLAKVIRYNCSIIFSTQILGLAEYTQSELKAQCFAFDLEHKITPGISDGGFEKLVARTGVEELLD